MDYVDAPNFMSVSGFDKILGTKKSIATRVRADDSAYVVAYPSANISELANTRDLYEDAVRGPKRHLVVCSESWRERATIILRFGTRARWDRFASSRERSRGCT